MLILKKYWREIIIVILIVIVGFSANQCSKQSNDIKLLTNVQDSAFNVAKFYKDKLGKATFQIKTHEITVRQLKEYSEQLGVDNKQLKKQVGNLNNLVAYWRVEASVKDTFKLIGKDTTIIYKDRPQVAKVFNYNNSFLILDQLYHPSDGTMSTSYGYNPSFSLTAYRKPQGFLKRKQLVADVRFDDQNVTVGNMKGMVITEEPKKWYDTKLVTVLFGFIVGFFTGKG